MSCDVCVVGSGPGGAIVADELSRAGQSVLVIEEGPLPERAEALTPKEVVATYYRDMGLLSTHWPAQVGIFCGRAFGGTSVINSGTCFHTPDRVFAWWNEALGIGFDVKAWREVERELDTELSVSPCPIDRMSPSNRLFAEGLEKLGLTGGSPLMRCETGCEGSGRCCFICPKDAKQAVNLNLLKRALEHGMRAIVETEAVKLNHNGRRITRLVCRTDAGGRLVVRAKRFVLAMGALFTPHFLMKNGLARHYPALGRHLSIHPAAKVFAEMPEPVHSWEGVPQAYRYEHPDHRDVHFEGIFLPAPLGAIGIPYLGADLREWMHAYDRLVGFGFFLSDSEHGRLFRAPGLGPVIRYGLSSRDVDNFCFAVKLIAQCYFAIGARRVLLPLLNPRNIFESAEQLEREFNRNHLQARELYAMGFHPLGTCRFSSTVEKGVVDQTGRCHEHDNLYICDGSAIPGPLHVNPQITIMTYSRLVSRGLI